MKRPIFLPALAALALAGCGGSNEAAEDSATTNAEVNTMAEDAANAGESAASMAAADFAAAVAASDLYEIESGRLAAEKASSDDIKAFGQMLVTDHQKSTTDLKSAAAQARPAVAVIPALEAEQTQMLEALRSASSGQFDRTFVDQQKQAHQKALDLLRRYSAEGDVEALKNFAAKATPIVQAHLERVNAMNP